MSLKTKSKTYSKTKSDSILSYSDPKNQETGIIMWDIDGVLVYVGDSYRKAIVETVQYYFTGCMDLKIDGNLMVPADTQKFKLTGNFNNDWELTYAAVLCFLCHFTESARWPKGDARDRDTREGIICENTGMNNSQGICSVNNIPRSDSVNNPPKRDSVNNIPKRDSVNNPLGADSAQNNPGMKTTHNSPDRWNIESLTKLKKLREIIVPNNQSINLNNITTEIKKNGGGLKGTEIALRGMYGKNLDRVKEFWFPDLIKRIFQEFYLGQDLFIEKYSEKPLFIESPGFIRNETPLITQEILGELSKKYFFGIATGRERFEANIMLETTGFDRFFDLDQVVSSDDVPIGKPDPAQLLECKRRICKKYNLPENTSAVYVGDTIDDIKAAKNAIFFSIGSLSCVSNQDDKERLRRALQKVECDLIVEDTDMLRKYLMAGEGV